MVRGKASSRLSELRNIRDRSAEEDGSAEAARRSHSIAFHDTWTVHRDYVFVDGLLVPSGGILRHYYPAGTPDIIQEFQKLSASDDSEISSAILSFARRWGHLGHDETHTGNSEGKRGGDPVEWILSHSRDVNLVLGLVQLARIGDETQITKLLERIYFVLYGASDLDDDASEFDNDAIEIPGRPGVFWTRDRAEAYREQLQLADWRTVPNSRHHAITVAASIISTNVSNIRMSASVDEANLGIRRWFTFEALVDVIWWHTMELTSGSTSLGICPSCGSIFKPTRSNQIYCPPPSYSVGKASLCSVRFRMRKQRAK